MTHPIAFCKKGKPQVSKEKDVKRRRTQVPTFPYTWAQKIPKQMFHRLNSDKLLKGSKIWEESGFPDVDLLVLNDRDDGIRLEFQMKKRRKKNQIWKHGFFTRSTQTLYSQCEV